MGLRGESTGRLLRRALALLLLAALAAGLPACKRNPSGQLPAASGEAIKAKREAIKLRRRKAHRMHCRGSAS